MVENVIQQVLLHSDEEEVDADAEATTPPAGAVAAAASTPQQQDQRKRKNPLAYMLSTQPKKTMPKCKRQVPYRSVPCATLLHELADDAEPTAEANSLTLKQIDLLQHSALAWAVLSAVLSNYRQRIEKKAPAVEDGAFSEGSATDTNDQEGTQVVPVMHAPVTRSGMQRCSFGSHCALCDVSCCMVRV